MDFTTLAELKAHIFTLPDHPDLIPYRTSYYKESWGFCMSHRQLAVLEAAGGHVTRMDGHRMRYNCRESILNGDFIAFADPKVLPP